MDHASHHYERVTNQESVLSTSMEAMFDKHGNELDLTMSDPPDVLGLQEIGIDAQHNMKVRSLFPALIAFNSLNCHCSSFHALDAAPAKPTPAAKRPKPAPKVLDFAYSPLTAPSALKLTFGFSCSCQLKQAKRVSSWPANRQIGFPKGRPGYQTRVLIWKRWGTF